MKVPMKVPNTMAKFCFRSSNFHHLLVEGAVLDSMLLSIVLTILIHLHHIVKSGLS
jgi:hypothetical protein